MLGYPHWGYILFFLSHCEVEILSGGLVYLRLWAYSLQLSQKSAPSQVFSYQFCEVFRTAILWNKCEWLLFSANSLFLVKYSIHRSFTGDIMAWNYSNLLQSSFPLFLRPLKDHSWIWDSFWQLKALKKALQKCDFSIWDHKYPFWANLVQKIKIVSLIWNLAPSLIGICRIQWLFPFSRLPLQIPFLGKFGQKN